jgi:hypothetical protein
LLRLAAYLTVTVNVGTVIVRQLVRVMEALKNLDVQALHEREGFGLGEEGPKSSLEGQLVREVLYGNRCFLASLLFHLA